MYRPTSPAYDSDPPSTPRRVKPLPKRRRTSEHAPHGLLDGAGSPGEPGSPHSPALAAAAAASPAAVTVAVAAGEEQAAPDPMLAAQTALEAYYMPVLGGVRDLFKHSASGGGDRGTHTHSDDARTGIDLSAALAGMGSGLLGLGGPGLDGYAHGLEEEEDGDGEGEGGEGDYVDHLQQPGNTKKRKVPANMSGSAHGHDGGDGDGGSGAEDEGEDRARGIPTGRERDADSVSGSAAGSGGDGGGGGGGGNGGLPFALGRSGLGTKKGKLSRAALAGLQHKELLRARKRQLSAVVSTLPYGDTLVLEQALSASAPFLKVVANAPRVRLSRRRWPRLARALVAQKAEGTAGDENTPPAPAPSSDFTFVFQCVTADRHVAMTEEVAVLHSRFEAELARQVAKAAEAAKQAAATLNGPLAKRTADRSKQAARTTGPKNAAGGDQKGPLEQSLLGTKGKGGKKKKRSALANASNPHHLRNYVPSRLPHSGPPNAQQAVQNAQNLLTPLPMRFLSAEIPPRRRKAADGAGAGAGAAGAGPTLTNPAEEWICPFCEYELFYGDEGSYTRAVRNRKKILRRRRRARERAAAAASGVAPAAGAGTEEEEGEAGMEYLSPAGREGVAGGKQGKTQGGQAGGAHG